MKRIRIGAVLLVLAGLSACGTVEGIGKDISSGARKVQSWL